MHEAGDIVGHVDVELMVGTVIDCLVTLDDWGEKSSMI